LEART